jgi:hypothetical protein
MPVNITAVTNENHKITPMIKANLNYTAGLTDEGKIVIAGKNSEERQKIVDDLTDVVQIDITYNGLAALKSDGTVAVRFWNQVEDYGQSEAENWSDIVQISFSDIYIGGLKSDGTIVYAGKYKDEYKTDISTWTDITQVSAYGLIIGLKSDGTVTITGDNAYGYDKYIAEMSTWTDIVQIITSGLPIVGIKSDGSVVTAWGNDASAAVHYEDIPTWTDIVSVEVNNWHVIGIKKDGNVVMDGKNWDIYEPQICCYSTDCYEIEKWTDIISITSAMIDGEMHYIGLKSDGTVILGGGDPIGACAGVEDWDLISEPQVGDLDGDKAVGITDLVTMAKFVHNRVPLTEETFATADLNADNTVNAIDLSILKWLMMKV